MALSQQGQQSQQRWTQLNITLLAFLALLASGYYGKTKIQARGFAEVEDEVEEKG